MPTNSERNKFHTSTLTNMVTMHNFDVTSVKFNTVGICNSGNHLKKLTIKLYIVNL